LSDPRTYRLYKQEVTLILISVKGLVYPKTMVQPEGLSYWISPMNLWGIEPATFQLVTQCLNQQCRPKSEQCKYSF